MKINEIRDMIEETERYMAPLQERLKTLTAHLKEVESREFIAAHKITMQQVETSRGHGKPYFGHFTEFMNWMDRNRSIKPWVEWNGTVYRTADFRAGAFDASPARLEHIPGASPKFKFRVYFEQVNATHYTVQAANEDEAREIAMERYGTAAREIETVERVEPKG